MGSLFDSVPPLSAGVEFPILETLGALGAAAVLLLFTLQTLKAPRGRAARSASASQTPAVAVPATPPPKAPPLPMVPQYKRAPIAIHLPQIAPEFPDVWGVNDPLEIVLKTEDKEHANLRQIPGLSLTLGGEAVVPVFNQGTATVRHAFRTRGDKPIVVDMRLPGENQLRRTQRDLKVVEYRAEIAEVFATFKEEAGRAIAPLREDATPWEMFDILTGANPKLPTDALRHVITCYEEAKYSNHPVTRKTYEKLIQALLQLERVDL